MSKLARARAATARARAKAKEHGTGVLIGGAVSGAAVGYLVDRKDGEGKSVIPERIMGKDGDPKSGFPTVAAAGVAVSVYQVWSSNTEPMIQGIAAGLLAMGAREMVPKES